MKLWQKITLSLAASASIFFVVLIWRSRQQFDAGLTLSAVHMKYACGECSLDMKVLATSDTQFLFLVQQEIFPVAANKPQDALCTYIVNANDNTAYNEKDTGLQFNIAGRLHKYRETILFPGCGAARCFVVDSIQYGNSGWVKF
jgi:hypothetical protein